MTTVTISLPESLKGFIDGQVSRKGYGNVSEYFRTLLREAREKERAARLQDLLLAGLNSGRIPITDRFWKDLRSEAIHLTDKRRKRRARK